MNILQVTPFMHVENLEQALAFFTDILGFNVLARYPSYAYVHRETTASRLLESHGADGAPPGNRIALGHTIDPANPVEHLRL